MNDNMIKIKYRGFFRGFALVLIFLICSNSILNAQKKSKKKKPEYDVEFGLVTYYDDNILKYSKTSNVVNTISGITIKDMDLMTKNPIRGAMSKERIVEQYQKQFQKVVINFHC